MIKNNSDRVLFERLELLFADIAGLVLLTIMALTVVSVVGRFLVGMPVPDAEGISSMLLVCVVYFPIAYCQKLRQHVAVVLFTDPLKYKIRQYFIKLGYLIGFLAFGALSYSLTKGMVTAYIQGDAYLGVNHIVTWPSRAFAVLGSFMVTVRLFLDFVNGFGNSNRKKLMNSQEVN